MRMAAAAAAGPASTLLPDCAGIPTPTPASSTFAFDAASAFRFAASGFRVNPDSHPCDASDASVAISGPIGRLDTGLMGLALPAVHRCSMGAGAGIPSL